MTLNYKSLALGLITLMMTAITAAELPANAVWIDVRTPAEYEQGHLPEATLIPYDSIEKGIAALKLSKSTPIYLYCAVGGRAEKAKQAFEAIDYSAVTNVGGLADAQKLVAEN